MISYPERKGMLTECCRCGKVLLLQGSKKIISISKGFTINGNRLKKLKPNNESHVKTSKGMTYREYVTLFAGLRASLRAGSSCWP